MNERSVVRVGAEIQAFRETLQSMSLAEHSYPDERFGQMVCSEAINALVHGNYGVGCVLVDPIGAVVACGHNEAFWPSFRSDGHAEIVVLDRFEDEHPEVFDMSRYVLYVSLEPCPMCLSRLIISGVGTVKFVVEDDGGGMVRYLDLLPGNFRRLAQAQSFGMADCSPNLRDLARQIYLLNLNDLQARLRQRRSMK